MTRRDREEEISDEAQPIPSTTHTKKYGKLKYTIFSFLLEIRGLIKGILRIIKRANYLLLGFCYVCYGFRVSNQLAEIYRTPFIFLVILFLTFGFCASCLIWFLMDSYCI
ncbi:hypothetical protein GGR09_001450 [Bartonella heixiaziensis]